MSLLISESEKLNSKKTGLIKYTCIVPCKSGNKKICLSLLKNKDEIRGIMIDYNRNFSLIAMKEEDNIIISGDYYGLPLQDVRILHSIFTDGDNKFIINETEKKVINLKTAKNGKLIQELATTAISILESEYANSIEEDSFEHLKDIFYIPKDESRDDLVEVLIYDDGAVEFRKAYSGELGIKIKENDKLIRKLQYINEYKYEDRYGFPVPFNDLMNLVEKGYSKSHTPNSTKNG